jgi:hypothetical protein
MTYQWVHWKPENMIIHESTFNLLFLGELLPKIQLTIENRRFLKSNMSLV